MTNSWQTTFFNDCLTHNNQAELIIVEGVSAALAVNPLRNRKYQAVLAMQGKPMNVMKQPVKKVIDYPLFKGLIEAIGAGVNNDFDLSKIRYQRIILMMDADADGMHCHALMLMFFARLMQPLFTNNHIFMVRPPVGAMVYSTTQTIQYAYSQTDFLKLVKQLRLQAEQETQVLSYKSLAGVPSDVLLERCIHPKTRQLVGLKLSDAQMAMQILG